MTKDEMQTAEDDVQDIVNKYNGIIEKLCENKEKEIMEV